MAGVPPLKASAYSFEVCLVSQADTDIFQSNPTLASGDVKVSKDGGTLANITSLPTAISSGKAVTVALSSTEMNADRVMVLFSDAAGSEWQDLAVFIETETQQINDLSTFDPTTTGVDVTKISGDSTAADNAEAYFDGTGYSGANNTIGTVTALSSTGLDNITLSEPGSVPTWGTATPKTGLAWLLALARNKLTQTSDTQTLRNDADSADIATASVSDDGTTATRGEWS